MLVPSEARVLAIVGPTASGKTSLAIALAKGLGGEIIGTDSMQAYRGMDIGTATPSTLERDGIPHHMIDCWSVDQEVTVAEFQEAARSCINDVLARGRVPIVTGGSGLYVSAVLDDLRFPGTEPDVRERLEREAEQVGAQVMHDRLASIDPSAAAAILPTNTRRIVRALEVNEITSENFVASLPDPVDVYDTIRFGMDIPRPELDHRIEIRVDAMFEAGFADEVQALEQAGGLGRTAAVALGYPQVRAALRGECSMEQARQSTIDLTRKFARRQQRWFRRDTRITWMPYDASDAADRVVRGFQGT